MNLNSSLAIKGAVEHAEAELTRMIDEQRKLQRRAMGDERDGNGNIVAHDRDAELKASARLAAYRETYALVADAGARIDKALDEK
ncbi:MAG: hypothetical protein ABFC31_07170 [Clostridiaceae bacterium]